MDGFRALYWKELKGYAQSLLSYIFIVVFLGTLSWFAWQNIFLAGQASMRDFFGLMPWFMLFLLPALTMRIWSEEKRQGTIEHLLTLPISDSAVILAKYAAATTFLAGILVLSLPMPLTLAAIGPLDWGQTLAAYLGVWLFGSAIIALGQWVSSLTQNQIIAFLLTLAGSFVCMVFGLPLFTSGVGPVAEVFYVLSTYTHVQNITRGVIALQDVVYFVVFAAVFLYFNLQTVHARHQTASRSVQAALMLVIAVAINAIMLSVPLRFDATDDKVFTLSDSSRDILEAAEEPVELQLIFSDDVPQDLIALRRDTLDLLNEYDRVEGDGVVLTTYNTPEEADDAHPAAQLAEGETPTIATAQYAQLIPPLQFNVVESDSFAVTEGYAGLVIEYGDKREVIPVLTEVDNLEYEVTARIQKMSREDTPKIAFLSDHGTSATTTFQQALSQQFDVVNVTLSDIDTVNSLVIVGPTEEFTKKERYALDQFVMRGGKLFVFADGTQVDQQLGQVTPTTTNINDVLSTWGVQIESSVAADFLSPETLTFGGTGALQVLRPYPYWPRIIPDGLNDNSPITANVQSVTLPWPSPLALEPRDGATTTELVATSGGSYAVSDVQGLLPDDIPQPAEDELGVLSLAASITGTLSSGFSQDDLPQDANPEDYIAKTDNATVIVFGSGRLIADEYTENGVDNALVASNAIDVTTQEISLAAIRARNALSRPIEVLEESQKTVIKYVNIFSSAIIVVFVGLGVTFQRRRRDVRAEKRYSTQ